MRVLLAMGLGLALAAPMGARAQDAAEGQKVFKTYCNVCHDVAPGKNRVGPSLFDIYGRKTAAVAGFRYSAANKAADLTWDAPTLDRYLTNPRAVVPGTTMTFVGLKDDKKRADLIAYLETLK